MGVPEHFRGIPEIEEREEQIARLQDCICILTHLAVRDSKKTGIETLTIIANALKYRIPDMSTATAGRFNSLGKRLLTLFQEQEETQGWTGSSSFSKPS